MRRGGVQVLAQSAPPKATRRTGLLALAVLVVAGGIGYGAYRANTVSLEETPPLRPLSDKELAAYLARDQLSIGRLNAAFALNGSGDWPTEPRELASSLRARSSQWSLDRPLTRDVYTADETLGALSAEASDKPPIYPLEAALAMAAVLRANGTPAMVVETWDLGEPSPPDPSGRLGYFLVATFDDDGTEPTAYFDPWGGRGRVEPIEARVLRDTEVIAAGLSADAIRIIVRSGDGARALPLAETALRMDPLSPAVRSVHGTILLETGGVTAGSQELEAARELRADGPRELNLVQLSLATAAMMDMRGQAEAAEQQLSAASQTIDRVVDRWPRYARAYRVRAMLSFGVNEPERAREALEMAQSLDPSSAVLWTLWSQFYITDGEFDLAAARARRAVELDPENWQQRLQVARILLEVGEPEGAKAQTDAAIALVPAEKRADLQRYLDQAFGAGVDSRGGSVPAAGDFSLDLDAPSLAEPASPPAGQDPALMLGDPSNLRLRDPDQDLRLDLDN